MLKLTDNMFRSPQISYRFPSIIFDKRKVTSPDEELRTILRHPFVIHFTDEKFCLLTFWFLEGFLQVRAAWDFSLTDFPPASGVVLALFPDSPPSTIPFPLLLQTTSLEHCDSIDRFERKCKHSTSSIFACWQDYSMSTECLIVHWNMFKDKHLIFYISKLFESDSNWLTFVFKLFR
jgi:hypothetical protein